MRSAKVFGPVEFAFIGVDGDDLGGTSELGANNCSVAHATTTDDGNAVSASDIAGVEGGSDACHNSTAEQAGNFRRSSGVDFGALSGGNKCLFGERADAESWGELSPVGERHFLRGVVSVEAILR